MKYFLYTRFNLFVCILLLAACGGGGGGNLAEGGPASDEAVVFSGNTSPAAIEATNVIELGKAAGESVQHAAAASAASPVIPNKASANEGSSIYPDRNNALLSVLDARVLSNRTVDLPLCDSGTAVLTDDSTGPITSGPLMFKQTYTDCAISDYIVDGTVLFDYEEFSTPFVNSTRTYENLVITDVSTGDVFTLNGVQTCDATSLCTLVVDYVGSDGRTHRIAGFSINIAMTIGLDGTLTIFHDTIGASEVIFEGITYSACGDSPDGGSIILNSADGSMGTITYNSDCSVTGTWLDSSGGAGSF